MKRFFFIFSFTIISLFSFSQSIEGKWNFDYILPETIEIGENLKPISDGDAMQINADGSFHKPKQITSVEDWKRTNQGGTTNVFYPEAVQISEDVVYVRFYFEGVLETNGKTSDYRTRVTMNWIKEDGNWVVKSQHYSPANYGGVHITQAADFEE